LLKDEMGDQNAFEDLDAKLWTCRQEGLNNEQIAKYTIQWNKELAEKELAKLTAEISNVSRPFQFGDIVNLMLACLLNLDDFSDGVFLTNLVIADGIVHDKFVQSFQKSSWLLVQEMAPFMNAIHMWGLGLYFLLLSQSFQWLIAIRGFFANIQIIAEGGGMAYCQAVGFEALARRRSHERANKHKVKNLGDLQAVIMGIAVVVLENCTSGMLSSSFLMFRGVEDLLDQPIALISALLSAAALLMKGLDYLRQGLAGQCIGILAPFPILVAAWIFAKLYFMQTCPGHAWQLTSGCMELEV